MISIPGDFTLYTTPAVESFIDLTGIENDSCKFTNTMYEAIDSSMFYIENSQGILSLSIEGEPLSAYLDDDRDWKISG